MKNSMFTLVAAECIRCGSTEETVKMDRLYVNPASGVCCEPSAESVAVAANFTSTPRIKQSNFGRFCGKQTRAEGLNL
jgi:hypothetical protein